jgi:hypothetical protein
MPTPVEVSHIKCNRTGIEGLGGTWRDRPWYLSLGSLIWEIERPDRERQRDFFVTVDGRQVPIVVVSNDGRKHLMAAGRPFALLELPEWRPEQPIPS